MINIPIVVADAITQIDKQSFSVIVGLLFLLIKEMSQNRKRLSELCSKISVLEEKISRAEIDMNTLEKTYVATNIELRHHLKYQDGKIIRGT